MGKMRSTYTVLVGTPAGRYHSEDLGVDGRIILHCILAKYDGTLWTEFFGLNIGARCGLL
jgi:hypothetical protein